MKIFAISDLHLSINNSKPMNIFGPVWEGYLDKIFSQWREMVGQDDIVLLAGDLSWAMRLEEVVADLDLLKDLPGQKVAIYISIKGDFATQFPCNSSWLCQVWQGCNCRDTRLERSWERVCVYARRPKNFQPRNFKAWHDIIQCLKKKTGRG